MLKTPKQRYIRHQHIILFRPLSADTPTTPTFSPKFDAPLIQRAEKPWDRYLFLSSKKPKPPAKNALQSNKIDDLLKRDVHTDEKHWKLDEVDELVNRMSWKDEIEEIKEDISGELNKNPKEEVDLWRSQHYGRSGRDESGSVNEIFEEMEPEQLDSIESVLETDSFQDDFYGFFFNSVEFK
ncbi:unnamed protein product [Enterobius vermicularis]|uniref:Chloroplast envelope membrane protein n=1 Tax=Enterobius vermicularis TaxID=51028 RepID=A0A0N4UZM7_ENTVE|nr:unnamed protein product [Enterobius vermicularis]